MPFSTKILNYIKKIITYIRNFGISAFVDIVVFAIIVFVLKPLFGTGKSIIVGSVIARISSSLVNFKLNKALFLRNNSNHHRFFIRYYILWSCLLISTSIITYLINDVFSTHEVLAKMISDMSLGIFSFQIQMHWVFKEDDPFLKRGLYFKFVRTIFRMFLHGKVNIDNQIFMKEHILIGHHQNFYGPFLALSWLPDTVHFWVVDHLFNFKDCFKMYYHYTFTKTIKLPKLVALILATLCALFIPPLVRSSRSIPVYRDSKNIITTLNTSLAYLKKGEQIMIFPDIQYNDSSPLMKKIYTGFTHLEKLYYQSTSKHIGFVPIIIDKETETLTNTSTLIFPDDKDYLSEKDLLVNKIVESINSKIE